MIFGPGMFGGFIPKDTPVTFKDAPPEPCWTIGCPNDAVEDSGGRVLCNLCRQRMYNPVGVIHRSAYWDYSLKRCWRCIEGEVDEKDELGLCGDCLPMMKEM